MFGSYARYYDQMNRDKDYVAEARFDAVVALFHVVSYLANDQDLRACFGAVAAHLEPGGPFLFDVWYGPAVLKQRPSIRVHRVRDSALALTRIAVPELLAAEKLVDVHFQLFARHLATGRTEEVRETHRMRYLFAPELTTLLDEAGLTLRHQEAWLSGEPPSEDTWSVTVIACRAGLGDGR